MNVLLVGLDSSVLASGDVDSDTRQRHVDYAATLAEHRPGSHVYMVVQSLDTDGLEPEQISEHLTVIPTNSARRGLFFVDILRIGRWLFNRRGIDLVTTQSPFDDGLAGYLLARRHDTPYLAQLRPSNLDDPYWLAERWINRPFRYLGKFVCRRADGVRVVSETSYRWCTESLGVPADRLHLNHISMSMLKTDSYQSTGVETDGDLILYVGRLAVEKNLPTLIRAFERVADERPESELLIVGDGPEQESLSELVDSLELADSVTFEGSVPYEELPAYYDRAAVVVLPSLHENFGRVILEAFAFGTPVVATDAEGPVELVEPGETGHLVPKEDPGQMAETVLSVLDSPAERDRMGENARTYVRSNFDPDQLIDDLVTTWITVAERSCH